MLPTTFRRIIPGSASSSRIIRRYCATELGKTETQKYEAVLAEIEVAEGKLVELKEKKEFQISDLANAKRRHFQAIEDAEKYAITKYAKEVLSIIDNLERAKNALKTDEIEDSSPEKDAMKKTYDGVDKTEKLLRDALKKYKIEQFNPQGEKFDPNKCEAMFRMAAPGVEPNTIVHVMETGYIIHERVLRAARVGTSQ